MEIQELPLWEAMRSKNKRFTFEIELTARCNNNCSHCYVNLSAGDRSAFQNELSLAEIESIAGQAVEMGMMWCTITGGEPLLRTDFEEIYLLLKRKGFLITLFTNACLINEHLIELFKRYPPRDIEVTVYGVNPETYEAVTRTPGSFKAFKRGIEMLESNGIKVTYKAMVVRSNLHEIDEIIDFCKARSKIPFRFDPFLHLRYDGDAARNVEIRSERLSPEEVVQLETSNKKHFRSLLENCDHLIVEDPYSYSECMDCHANQMCENLDAHSRLFSCGIGVGEFNISYNGRLRLCSALVAPEFTYNLRAGSLQAGLAELSVKVKQMKVQSERLMRTCKSCNIVNLCGWCSATAYLETGSLEGEVPFFCQVAHARAAALQLEKGNITKRLD